jgi:YVTN family beta-propeller protein
MRLFMVRFLVVLLALAAALPARAAETAIVLNSGSGSVSLVDMASQAEIKRIPVLREPHHLALSPDQRSLLVGDSGGNEMLFLDPETGAIQRRMPIADPYQLGFSPDGKLLTVTGLARNQVDVYDAATMQLKKRFPIHAMPSHLAYAPDSSVVYVTLQGSNQLAAFDLRDMTTLWVQPVGETPAGVLWLGGKLLVADMGTDYIAVVDPTDGRVERRVTTGRGAHQLFLSPDRRTLWVNNRVAGTTTALDPETLAVERTYKVPGGPDCIDFAPDGKLWITQRFAQEIGVLDPRTGELHSMPVGRSPHGIFLTTDLRTPASATSARPPVGVTDLRKP